MNSIENKLSAILPAPHEEILGIFLKFGQFREYRGQLTAPMFQEYAWLFEKMLETDNVEPLTFTAVAGRCRDRLETLHQLRSVAMTVHTLPSLIATLKKQTLAQRMNAIARDTYNETRDVNCDADEVLLLLQEKVFALHTSENDKAATDPERSVDDWHEWLTEIMSDPSKAFGMMTNLEELDRLTTGWHRTDFIVIGARTSMGKSAFVLDNLLRLTQAGYRCALYSLEMSKRQIYNRMIANLMGASLTVIKTGQMDKERFKKVVEYKALLKNIYVDDTRGVSADYIAESMRQVKRSRGLDFVAVDYIQDVAEKGEQNDNGGSAIARICRKLRKAAQECDCAVMGMSQVSRDVEKRQDKRPGVADLSGSTGIETSADVIGLLYRDDYYTPTRDRVKTLEINIAKHRNGETGKVELGYDLENQRIVNLEHRR